MERTDEENCEKYSVIKAKTNSKKCSGAGRDTRYLIKKGWNVLAIDKNSKREYKVINGVNTRIKEFEEKLKNDISDKKL